MWEDIPQPQFRPRLAATFFRRLPPQAGWPAGGSFLENVCAELSFGDNQGPPSAACPTPWGCFVFAFQQVTSAKFPVTTGGSMIFVESGGWLTPARRGLSSGPVAAGQAPCRRAVPWVHLPFVKAELQVFPHRKALSLHGRRAHGLGCLMRAHSGLSGRVGSPRRSLKDSFVWVGACGHDFVLKNLNSWSCGRTQAVLKASNKISSPRCLCLSSILGSHRGGPSRDRR